MNKKINEESLKKNNMKNEILKEFKIIMDLFGYREDSIVQEFSKKLDNIILDKSINEMSNDYENDECEDVSDEDMLRAMGGIEN